jgi:hypothetical protein
LYRILSEGLHNILTFRLHYTLDLINVSSLTSALLNDSIFHSIFRKTGFQKFFYEPAELLLIAHSWSELALILGAWPDTRMLLLPDGTEHVVAFSTQEDESELVIYL